MPKILAIDDSPTLRKFISKHLGERFPEATILLASNGSEGLDLAQQEIPDVILLDYLLPDAKGDEICTQLAAQAATADIPVILMSSSTPDITRTESMFPAIRRSMAKPFSPELLCASVHFVLNASEQEAPTDQPDASSTSTPSETAAPAAPSFAPESAPTLAVSSVPRAKVSLTPSAPPPKSTKPVTRPLGSPASGLQPEFCGPLNAFPLIRALLAAQSAQLTGTFSVEALPLRIDLYFLNGQPVLASTRETPLYLKNAPVSVPPEQAEVFDSLKKHQETTGEPIFLQMKTRGMIPAETADAMAREYSGILFSNVWSLTHGRFQFLKQTTLPDFAAACAPLEESTEQFALVSLRHLGPDSLAFFQNEKAPGVPAYTPAGYLRIQKLLLEPEEAAFAEQVAAGGKDLGQIADALGIPLPDAQILLFRFLCLEVFDYWPAAGA